MKDCPLPFESSEASLEDDAVWKLLDQAGPVLAGPRFTDDTVRLARLAGQAGPSWWRRLVSPVPLAALAGAAAAVVLSLQGGWTPASGGGGADPAVASRAAEIQDIAETETLIAAVDHLEDFSDTELVTLIGF